MEDRRDDLINLGHDLSAVYFPTKVEDKFPQNREITYLGELKALVNLCDYATKFKVPRQIWRKIGKSKYAEPILNSLLKNGPMLANDLSKSVDLPHFSQLSRIVRPLILEKVVSIEELGKNTWYSLTSTGRLIASKRFGGEDFKDLDKVIPLIVLKLKEDWCSVSQIVDLVSSNVIGSSRYILVNILLLALREAGIIEEKDNKWKINNSLIMSKLEWAEIKEKSINPLLGNIKESIKQTDFTRATDQILEVRNILNNSGLKYVESEFALDLSGVIAGTLHGLKNKNNEIVNFQGNDPG